MWQTKFGRCIYTSPSGYQVHQNLFYRWLTLGSDALQTVINRRHPQSAVLYYLPAITLMARHYPGTACLLGLGGAGVPLMLGKNYAIDVIENSKEVIDMAKHYFIEEPLPYLNIIQADAQSFVQSHTMVYKHLLVDLYNAHHFPTECATVDFFFHCKNQLSEDGFLAVNLANGSQQWLLFQIIKNIFGRTLTIPVKNCANLVIIATKSHDLLQQIEKTKELMHFTWLNTWGWVSRD